jgi:hypothetical protein
MSDRKSTMVELVDELQKLPQTEEILKMIVEAKAGEYHDHKSRKYACGKMESSQRLRVLGHRDLAVRIENGEFDEEADEEDKQQMRDDLLKDMPKEQAEIFMKQLGL